MAVSRQECEFFLLRYVPDPVRDEFVHVGVLLREAARRKEESGRGDDIGRELRSSPEGRTTGRVALRFTADWRRVRCLDPEADVAMLEGLESELRRRFEEEPEGNLMHVLEDSFSNSVQMTRGKGYLVESMETGVEELMRMYVEAPKRERTPRLAGRAAIQAQMRSEFERAGVWDFLRKRIEASEYTRVGDPLRIDYGYRTGDVIRMFHAVSLETGVEMAKVLSFSANSLIAGVQRVDRAGLELTAVVEPLRQGNQKQGTGSREPGTGTLAAKERPPGTRAGGSNSRFPLGNDRKKSSAKGGDEEAENRAGSREVLGAELEAEVDSERVRAYRFAVETMEEHRIRVLTTADLGRIGETARRELRV